MVYWFGSEVGIVCFYVSIRRLICVGIQNSFTHSLHTHTNTCTHTHFNCIWNQRLHIGSLHQFKIRWRKRFFSQGKIKVPRSDSYNTAWLLFIFSDWLTNVCWELRGDIMQNKPSWQRIKPYYFLCFFLFCLLSGQRL